MVPGLRICSSQEEDATSLPPSAPSAPSLQASFAAQDVELSTEAFRDPWP